MSRRSRRAVLGGLVFCALIAVLLSIRGRGNDARPVPPGEIPGRSVVALSGGANQQSRRHRQLRGRVLDGGRAGIAGAVVVLSRQRDRSFDDGAAQPLRTRSAPGGHFRFEELPAARFTVTASAAGLTARSVRGLDLTTNTELEVDVVLDEAGIVLSGTVLDASGGAIEGASVQAWSYQRLVPGEHSDRAVFEGTSGADGRYEIQLAPGGYHLLAAADGYANSKIFATLTIDDSRHFLLEPAGQISGQVTSAETGKPLPGAFVWAQPKVFRLDFFVPPVRADGDGHYRLSGLPGGNYRVSGRSGELAATLDRQIGLVAGGNASGVDLELARGLKLAGTVKGNEGDGTPEKGIPNVRVGLWPTDWLGTHPHETRTDANGRYTVTGIVPGHHQISLSADGYVERMEGIPLPESTERDFVLRASARVSGQVVTSAGARAAGATVEARVLPRERGPMSVEKTRTDTSGSFELRRIAAGQLYVTVALGQEVAEIGPEEVGTTGRKTLQIRLGEGARISGQVVRSDGSSAVGVRVRAQSGNGSAAPETRTAAEGGFDLGPLPAGTVSVIAGDGGVTTDQRWQPSPERLQVTLAPGERKHGVRLTLQKPSSPITGIVVGPANEPVAGVTVEAFSEGAASFSAGRAVSDGAGRFQLTTSGTGPFRLRATHPDHAEAIQGNVAPGAAVQLRLSRPALIAGVVVTTAGDPVIGYSIASTPRAYPGQSEALKVLAAGPHQGAQRVSNKQGRFEIEGLRPGVHDVIASALDGRIARAEGVSLEPGEQKRGLRLTLEAGLTVVGSVVAHGSETAIAGVDAAVSLPSGSISARTDRAGRFVLGPVPRVPGIAVRVAGLEQARYVSEVIPVRPSTSEDRVDIGIVRLVSTDPANPMKARLGVRDTEQNGRVVIAEVAPWSPAHESGVRAGDVVLSINGEPASPGGPRPSRVRLEYGQQMAAVVQSPGQPSREVRFGRRP
jgi:protocatechuate 3,4-dioxygenase beta subunit